MARKQVQFCIEEDCNDPVMSRDRCEPHYRKEVERLRTAGDLPARAVCSEPECDKPLSAWGLCNSHYRQCLRKGTTKRTVWQGRESHPLYERWASMRRRGGAGFVVVWKDFWRFVEDVSPVPSPERHALRPVDPSIPIGPSNFAWQPLVGNADHNDYMRAYWQRNAKKLRERSLRSAYGIGIDDYDRMLSEQREVCAICGNPETAMHRSSIVRRLCVDHCHKTGHVRGLLCAKCNRAIGLFADDPNILHRAIDYLRNAERDLGAGLEETEPP